MDVMILVFFEGVFTESPRREQINLIIDGGDSRAVVQHAARRQSTQTM